ncbi:MAG: alpha/beta hydrolase [Synergistaceae bacterium]|jgi:pimeloyl-ACP methyl ester carboxylesterase|nr:alpha/beta hydrolase [Synergistaceae bacterium]
MCDKKANYVKETHEETYCKKMRLDGIDVCYYDNEFQERRSSPGSAVLFLHGWGSDFSVFRFYMDRMTRRACALNLPGFGGSGEPPAPWGVDDYADFVASFLRKLEIDEVVLIGHSMGGRVAIKLAAQAAQKAFPFRIAKIVLVNSAGVKPRRTIRQRLRGAVYKCVKKALSLPVVESLFPGALENWRRKSGSADYRNASPRMRECLVKIVNEDLTPLFSSIPCPALLIWGENDRETPLGDGQIMERLIPDSGLVTLKNAGHFSFLDQPFVFGKVLDSFLGIEKTS